jgi:hypothetical protein
MEQNIQDQVGTMSLSEYANNYLQGFNERIEATLEDLNTRKGEKILKRNLNALAAFIEAKYNEGSDKKTEDELHQILQNHGIKNLDGFADIVEEWCYKPFKESAAKQFKGTCNLLSGKVYAINKKDLIEKVGEVKSEKTYQFVLDCYHLTPINYRFESFRDPELETIYSNDGLRLDTKKAEGVVNTFFRFFIDGDGYDKTYDPECYYGSVPVQESRIIAYCKQQSMPEDYIEKLLSIARCSSRFYITEDGKLSLKKQYLLNIYAISVAILYENGKPLHKEELCERIGKLHKQYPALVDEPTLDSFVLRRKPVLCSAGAQGEWMLRTWKQDRRDVLTVIRDFVADTYTKTQKPVHIDQIAEHVQSTGFNYGKRSIQTYVNKSGCKGVGDRTYYPVDSDQKSAERYFRNRFYIIQRGAAEYLLENGPSKRVDIINYITVQCGHSPNKITFDRALFEARPDLFIKEGKSVAQTIKLSDKITSKKSIKIEIPEPAKKESEYIVELRKGIIEYLKKNEKAWQIDLVELFSEKAPDNLKERKTPVRNILKDDNIFLKEKLGNKQIQVTLQPRYIEKLKLAGEYASPIISPSPVEKQFSWDGLKKGIITIMSTQEYDERLPHFVDNMLIILRGGYDDLLPTSNFDDLVQKLYKYVTDKTSLEERRGLRKEILLMMETYLKEFHRLMYHDSLNEYHSFYELKVLFIQKGLLPVKPDRNSGVRIPEDLFKIATAVERINVGRNSKAHSKAFESKDDKQTISDIHDCLLIMLHLAKKLNYTAEKSTLHN